MGDTETNNKTETGEKPEATPEKAAVPPKKKKPSVLWILVPASVLLFLLGLASSRLGWFEGQRAPAAAPTVAPAASPTPAPAGPEPLFAAESGYILSQDGLFYPESGLTRGEAEEILAGAGRSVSPGADREEVLTEETLCALAAEASDRETAENALDSIRGLGDARVTRAEVFFNRLFSLPAAEEELSYFPDVAPDYWAFGDIQTAAASLYCWPADDGRLPAGFMMLDGYLYLAGQDGYLVKNQYSGSLLFGNTGRYTSGSLELDDYVAAMLRTVTTDTMSRGEMLRAAYLYVRDNFTYLIRHYYNIGDAGWQLQEALTMYSTGKGNCYCYAAAFWAAARQLGYDAKIVSGTYGQERAPHGWVEIYEDGIRYTYDVEIEMVSRARPDMKPQDLYAMTDQTRINHGYLENIGKDNSVPRETNDGLLPR